MTNAQHPLAWSQAGTPIELSSEAEVWRVRRLNGSSRGGAPEVVYGEDGIPLLLALETTPEEFAEAVGGRPGKYRLDALDDSHNAISGTPPAYHVIGDGGRPREVSAATVHSPDVVANANNALVEALKDSSARMAQMVEATASIIHAADGAGIARRKPPPSVPAVAEPVVSVAVPAEDSAPQTPWWQELITGVLPVVVQMAPAIINLVAQARTAKAYAPPPRPSSAGPTAPTSDRPSNPEPDAAANPGPVVEDDAQAETSGEDQSS